MHLWATHAPQGSYEFRLSFKNKGYADGIGVSERRNKEGKPLEVLCRLELQASGSSHQILQTHGEMPKAYVDSHLPEQEDLFKEGLQDYSKSNSSESIQKIIASQMPLVFKPNLQLPAGMNWEKGPLVEFKRMPVPTLVFSLDQNTSTANRFLSDAHVISDEATFNHGHFPSIRVTATQH